MTHKVSLRLGDRVETLTVDAVRGSVVISQYLAGLTLLHDLNNNNSSTGSGNNESGNEVFTLPDRYTDAFDGYLSFCRSHNNNNHDDSSNVVIVDNDNSKDNSKDVADNHDSRGRLVVVGNQPVVNQATNSPVNNLVVIRQPDNPDFLQLMQDFQLTSLLTKADLVIGEAAVDKPVISRQWLVVQQLQLANFLEDSLYFEHLVGLIFESWSSGWPDFWYSHRLLPLDIQQDILFRLPYHCLRQEYLDDKMFMRRWLNNNRNTIVILDSNKVYCNNFDLIPINDRAHLLSPVTNRERALESGQRFTVPANYPRLFSHYFDQTTSQSAGQLASQTASQSASQPITYSYCTATNAMADQLSNIAGFDIPPIFNLMVYYPDRKDLLTDRSYREGVWLNFAANSSIEDVWIYKSYQLVDVPVTSGKIIRPVEAWGQTPKVVAARHPHEQCCYRYPATQVVQVRFCPNVCYDGWACYQCIVGKKNYKDNIKNNYPNAYPGYTMKSV